MRQTSSDSPKKNARLAIFFRKPQKPADSSSPNFPNSEETASNLPILLPNPASKSRGNDLGATRRDNVLADFPLQSIDSLVNQPVTNIG